MRMQPTSLSELRKTARQRLSAWKEKVTPFYKDEEIENLYRNYKGQVLQTVKRMAAFPTEPQKLKEAIVLYLREDRGKDEVAIRLRTIIDIMGVSQEKLLRMVHILRKNESKKPFGSRARWVRNIQRGWSMDKVARELSQDTSFAEIIAELLADSKSVLGDILPEFISNRMRFPLDMSVANRIAEDRAYTEIRNQIGEHLYRNIKASLDERGIASERGKYDETWQRQNVSHSNLFRAHPELGEVKDVDFYVPSRLEPKAAIEVQFGETTSQGMRTKAKVIERDFERLRAVFPELHTFSVVDGIGWEVLGDNDVIHFFNSSEVITISEIFEMINKINSLVKDC